MSKPRVAEITVYFQADIKTVWNVVTNNEDYEWRSDVKKIEISEDGKQWREYHTDKIYTKFILVEKTAYSRYIFNMENSKFTGHWTGFFYSTESGGTKVIFTENIFIKNPLVRIISYIFWDLKKIQRTYVRDLKLKLQEEL